MSGKRFKPAGIISKLREAKVYLAEGVKVDEMIRRLGVNKITYYRWRKEFGGMRAEQAKRLKYNKAISSMSGKGNCYDNAVVESFFKTIKSELIWRTPWQTRNQATREIGRYIGVFYNPKRRHSVIGYTSPIQYEIINK